MPKITENTMFSFGVVIALLGGMIWLTTLYNDVQASQKDIAEVKMGHLKEADDISQIRSDLSEIKGELKGIRKSLQ